jgi:hypothetical protein
MFTLFLCIFSRILPFCDEFFVNFRKNSQGVRVITVSVISAAIGVTVVACVIVLACVPAVASIPVAGFL